MSGFTFDHPSAAKSFEVYQVDQVSFGPSKGFVL